jgi:hypothetical protein
VRHLFLLPTRSHRLRLLQLLVLREFPLHRRLHGRRPRRILAVGSDESDWTILFTQWGLLAQDQKIGATMRALGWLGMLATTAWLANRLRHDATLRKDSPS